MNATVAVAAALVGYLFGSFSFARTIFRLRDPGKPPVPLVTPTTDGEAEMVSHAVGATNVMVAYGPKWGMVATGGDILKAFVPTLAFNLLYPGQPYDLICAGFVLAGHLFPVWYRFVGGGGNSSILGMLLAISPIGAVVTHGAGMLIGRFYPTVAFVTGVALTIPWFAWRDGPLSAEVAFAVAITVLYVGAQMPEALKMMELKRQGHILDTEHTMNMMKGAAATGRTGAEIAKERREEREGDQ